VFLSAPIINIDTLLLALAIRIPTLVQSLLLKQNVDIEARDDLGHTALMLAASGGHLYAVGYLAQMKAKSETNDFVEGRKVLNVAAAYG